MPVTAVATTTAFLLCPVATVSSVSSGNSSDNSGNNSNNTNDIRTHTWEYVGAMEFTQWLNTHKSFLGSQKGATLHLWPVTCGV